MSPLLYMGAPRAMAFAMSLWAVASVMEAPAVLERASPPAEEAPPSSVVRRK